MKNIPAQIWVGGAAFALPALFFLVKALTTPSAFSLRIPPQLVAVGLAMAAVAMLVRKAKNRVASSRLMGARVETHRFGPGRPLDTIRHELGHKIAIERQGGHVEKFVVNKDGSGFVRGTLPKRAGVVGVMATRYAGGLAEHTFAYAKTDLHNAEEDLKDFDVPPHLRGKTRSEAMSKARSILFWNPVEGQAKKVYRDGWGGS